MHNLNKRTLRNEARTTGSKCFVFTCEKHGSVEHYTATGSCKCCVAENKLPTKQAAYWLTVKDGINQKRRKN